MRWFRESEYRTKSDQDAVSGSAEESESEYRTESDQDAVSGSRAEPEQFSYFINWEGHFSYPSEIYHIGEVETQPYFVPVLLVEIPDDEQKEERINRMLLEHYVEVLPDAEEEEKIIPYSVLEQDEKKYSPRDWEKLYQEMESY